MDRPESTGVIIRDQRHPLYLGLLPTLQLDVRRFLLNPMDDGTPSWIIARNIPVIVEALGDYRAEMEKMLAEGGPMGIGIATPSMRRQEGYRWQATVGVEVYEVPAVNRALAAPYITAARAAEMILARLTDKAPPGWAALRASEVSRMAQTDSQANWIATFQTQTFIRHYL